MEKVRKKIPKITVITPTYNRSDFIKETIESVLNQNFSDFEYYILDDGSTDNTNEIVLPYLKDKRVKYLRNENVGEVETVNLGWSLAKGEYFTQVNSDDPILPGLFSEMVTSLDKEKDAIVAYSNFYFIDKEGEIFKEVVNPDWNYFEALKSFSCYAASPGAFIRRSAFKNWERIKNPNFKYISDIEMYWKMALMGNFLHIPKFLATWRSHDNGISADRYMSIPEVESWFEDYFTDCNEDIVHLKHDVRRSIDEYCMKLLVKSGIKSNIELAEKYFNKIYNSDNLQINDNDIVGNKFNGHDLHLYLREFKINSKQLVWNKESNDCDTYNISRFRFNRAEIFNTAKSIQKQYSLNSILNPIGYDILFDPLFLKSNLVHFHLIHNYIFDIQILPIMSRLKPIVWTLHDPWALGGHCIHHFGCQRWKRQCGNCPNLESTFKLEDDNSALNFAIKRDAIRNTNSEIIVASQWMKSKVEQSPIFKGKTIHVVPFGIDQEIFKPLEKKDARNSLGIDNDAIVISFRCDPSEFKGLNFIEHVLRNIKSSKKIILLVVANNLRENPKNFETKEYGWVKDDNLLAQIYSASDLFLMPSAMEAFGMMAIEAMSCGTLPIVVDGTALFDTINAPTCGVSTKKDVNEYLKAVQYYLDNESERKIRANRCLEYARIHYNKDVYIEKILKIYRCAKEKHKLEKEDAFLLDQLKKNALKMTFENLNSSDGEKILLDNKDMLLKSSIIAILFKYKNIIPKNIRVCIKINAKKIIKKSLKNHYKNYGPFKRKIYKRIFHR